MRENTGKIFKFPTEFENALRNLRNSLVLSRKDVKNNRENLWVIWEINLPNREIK